MRPPIKVYLVSGNRLLRESLARILNKRADISLVGAAPFSNEAFEAVAAADKDVLLLDSLPASLADHEVVQQMLAASPGLKVVLIGMEDDEEIFMRSVQAGAVGYVLKDASALDVVAAIRSAAHGEAVCPPHLCLSLFRRFYQVRRHVPNVQLRVHLGLTRREQQLVPLIAQGLTNKEIASTLHLSEQTIKNHIHRMLQKVGAGDRLQVVELCRLQEQAL